MVTMCKISMNLFSTVINLLVKSVKKPKEGAVLAIGVQQVLNRAFMDDLTITAELVLEGRWILEALVEITKEWRRERMEFKPLKSRSLVLKRVCIQDGFQLKTPSPVKKKKRL